MAFSFCIVYVNSRIFDGNDTVAIQFLNFFVKYSYHQRNQQNRYNENQNFRDSFLRH